MLYNTNVIQYILKTKLFILIMNKESLNIKKPPAKITGGSNLKN